ncbi:S-adenosyl-L-methionine-dependent methyltransferase [Aspergillus leporis]|uniref:S-adenosyl-L-methionine-dependent methyltransferase n=1 Tax=Aspergillus leporis TaxID=41062 RepID=A0A5N5X709_9EURO|nr:S-adenosyl-L-methionine-dependent methyltransferase [Aspergillus leporis]
MTNSQEEITVDSGEDYYSNYVATDSEVTSLRSSIADYIYENGRRYHAYHAGSYWGSNDDKSIDAMEICHHLYRLLLHDQLYLAPIKNPGRVLDVGTGTGSWATDFADLHPEAEVIGTDLSPIQPNFVPPNVFFEVDDCCDEWLYKHPFDFIHVRGLYGCVADWGKFYQQALNHLRPGAYLEQVEMSVTPISDDGSTKGTVYEIWGEKSLEAGDKFGKTLRIVDESRQRMIDAGFANVVEQRYKLPIGPWPKDQHLKNLGRYFRLVFEESLEMWAMMLWTKVLGWSREEVEVIFMKMRQALSDPSLHAYLEISVVYGQKPDI